LSSLFCLVAHGDARHPATNSIALSERTRIVAKIFPTGHRISTETAKKSRKNAGRMTVPRPNVLP